jgi:hypothetical protein
MRRGAHYISRTVVTPDHPGIGKRRYSPAQANRGSKQEIMRNYIKIQSHC